MSTPAPAPAAPATAGPHSNDAEWQQVSVEPGGPDVELADNGIFSGNLTVGPVLKLSPIPSAASSPTTK